MRQVAIPRLLDEIAAAATVASSQEDVDGWWCKAAPELPFRRANAALPPIGATTDRAALAISFGRVRAWYQAHGRRTIVQVSSACPDHRTLDAWLAGQGLAAEAPVHVMAAPLDRVARPVPGAMPGAMLGARAGGVEVVVGVDRSWAEALALEPGSLLAERTSAHGDVLAGSGDRALGAAVRVDGQVAGLGVGLVDRGWLGIFGMATLPQHRRQGIATSIVDALASAARTVDPACHDAYLQVEVGNHPAIATYRRCGFVVSHGYHYRSEGVDPAQGC